ELPIGPVFGADRAATEVKIGGDVAAAAALSAVAPDAAALNTKIKSCPGERRHRRGFVHRGLGRKIRCNCWGPEHKAANRNTRQKDFLQSGLPTHRIDG